MIHIRNLCVALGRFALHDISLKVETGEYFIILGPTGAGKTVLLEAIAGIYPCQSGEIWLGGRNVTGLEPDARKVGIVYQDHALFPHLSVRENIAFGLRMRKTKPPELKSKLEGVVHLLGLGPLLQRRPDTLSGGEKQKVALARALATGPEVLLLDEPLGALDPETREGVQQELRRLYAELSITVLHVTHDFEEAMTMGKRVAVIGGGSLKQVGTTEDIFRRPGSEFVARFVMTRNIFRGTAARRDDGTTVFKTGRLELISAAAVPDGECHASIRPEDILVVREPVHNETWNCLPAAVSGIVDKGSLIHVTASLPPDLVCMVTRHSFSEMGLRVGLPVFVAFPASSVHLFKE
jgi:molybdate/tungstate transport system ATP-binding protein